MEALFIKLVDMSITASYLIVAVLFIRLIFKKIPKAFNCVLWALVATRLILPFSIESIMSIVPSTEPVTQQVMQYNSPIIDNKYNTTDKVADSLVTTPGDSVNPVQIITFVATVVWILGLVSIIAYGVISYLRLKHKVAPSIKYSDNVFYCDNINTPFILGIFNPKIYIPSAIDKNEIEYIIAHEKAHISRHDHWWKPIGFLLLSVYWFNPLIWVGYIFLCKDIELACDEKVIKDKGNEYLKAYSNALVDCSIRRRTILACPLAFGEVGVKERVKSMLNYKKPRFWIIVIAILLCIAIAITLLTNPISKQESSSNESSNNNKTASSISKSEARSLALKEVNNELADEFDFDTANVFVKKSTENEHKKPIWVTVIYNVYDGYVSEFPSTGNAVQLALDKGLVWTNSKGKKMARYKEYYQYLIAEIDANTGEFISYTKKEAEDRNEVLGIDSWLSNKYGVDFKISSTNKTEITTSDYYEISETSNLNYKFIIKDKNGKTILTRENIFRPFYIKMINEDIIKCSISAGTGYSTNNVVYCDINTGFVSENFTAVLGEYDYKVITTSLDGENTYLDIKNIYTGENLEYIKLDTYKKSVEAILDFKIDNGIVTVTYIVDNKNTKKSITINLNYENQEEIIVPNPSDEKIEYLESNGYTTADDVDIHISEINLQNKHPAITIVWDNKKNQTIVFGESFRLHRITNDEEIDCMDSLAVWNSIAIITKSHNAERKYSLYGCDLSHNGTYRLSFDFDIENKGNNYKAVVEFKVKNNGTAKIEKGTVGFYLKDSNIIDKTTKLSSKDLNEVISALKNNDEWLQTELVDMKEPLEFNGRFYYDRWIYFDYKHNAVLCNNYICFIDKKYMDILKSLE